MMGGGFIGQMHSTNKQNRELVKNVIRRSSEPPAYVKDPKKRDLSITIGELSEDDKLYWKKRAEKQEARDNTQKAIIFFTALVITAILLFLFYAEVMDVFIETWAL
jgi:hypothetical protein